MCDASAVEIFRVLSVKNGVLFPGICPVLPEKSGARRKNCFLEERESVNSAFCGGGRSLCRPFGFSVCRFFLGEFWFVQWKDPPPEEVQLVVGWLVQFGLCGCSISGDWFSFHFFFVLLESSDSKWEKFR